MLDAAFLEVVSQRFPHLDPSQVRAVASAVSHRACLISGGAGAGKTTLIKCIAELYLAHGLHVALCAPTGKAARRLEQVVGIDAYTIHRLLEYMPRMGGFQRHAEHPLDADVVIVDEVSMMDSELAYHLFDAIAPRTAMVLVGDHHQLPPVGAGALLRDAIAHELLPLTILSQCHRQAGTLKQNCASLLLGQVADTAPAEPGKLFSPWYVDRRHESTDTLLATVERLFTEVLGGRWGFNLLADVQFLAPQKRGPIGTVALNHLLQKLHQQSLGVEVEPRDPEKPPALLVGDKVIQTRNNYDLDVMNGHQGVVLAVRPRLVIRFDEREIVVPNDCRGDIELAYCLTVHKVQGSEFPCVVFVCHRAHQFMLNRSLLYTAATRARQTCILLGDDRGIRTAATRVVTNTRRTLLPALAREVLA